MKKTLYVLVPVFALILASCKNEPAPTGSPVVTFASPTAGAHYDNGDTVHVSATITHTRELHNITVKVKRQDNGVELLSQEQHTHSETVSVNGYWVNDLPDAGLNIHVIVLASDHEGFSTTDTVTVGIN